VNPRRATIPLLAGIFLFYGHELRGEEESGPEKFSIGGEIRFRLEARENSDFSTGTPDEDLFIGSRIRLNTTLRPSSTLTLFIQPQFSGLWGEVVSTLNGAGTTTSAVTTSGSLKDPALSLHQAYIDWKTSETVALRLGRQEFAYGDHAVIGNVGFSNVGRSFDAGLARWTWKKTTSDLFYSILAEDDVTGSGISGDSQFGGLYVTTAAIPYVSAADGYALWLYDKRSGSPALFHFATLGTRWKLGVENADGRIESNFQIGSHLGADMLAYMVDVEGGYTFSILKGLRFGLEYNRASGDDPATGTFTRYHQLFPTAHRWLGYMDFFGRQNIQSGVFHSSLAIDSHWAVSADFHAFWRVETSDILYSVVTEAPMPGQASPPTSLRRHVGEELDLLISYSPEPYVSFEVMGGLFFPGGYLNAVRGDDLAYSTYLQAKFSM
jgi:hypothetical protein